MTGRGARIVPLLGLMLWLTSHPWGDPDMRGSMKKGKYGGYGKKGGMKSARVANLRAARRSKKAKMPMAAEKGMHDYGMA